MLAYCQQNCTGISSVCGLLFYVTLLTLSRFYNFVANFGRHWVFHRLFQHTSVSSWHLSVVVSAVLPGSVDLQSPISGCGPKTPCWLLSNEDNCMFCGFLLHSQRIGFGKLCNLSNILDGFSLSCYKNQDDEEERIYHFSKSGNFHGNVM